MGHIFSDEAPKKRDKCIQMHNIGKSYATTEYKCDDEKNDPFFVWNNCNICRQCILMEKTVFQCETDWDELLTI